MSKKIKVAIAGIGNCASSLVQGCEYYVNEKKHTTGLLNYKLGDYLIKDIEFVAAFDVDKRKVRSDLATAINSGSNCTKKICNVLNTGVIVQKFFQDNTVQG